MVVMKVLAYSRVGNSLFRSSLFCSRSLILKRDCEQFALVRFKKEQPWANCCGRFLQKSDHLDNWVTVSEPLSLLIKKIDMSDCLWFKQITLKNECFALKKIEFFKRFWQFFPFFMSESKSLPSLFAQLLFLKSNGNNSISSLITKERPWAICSGRSLQKSDR